MRIAAQFADDLVTGRASYPTMSCRAGIRRVCDAVFSRTRVSVPFPHKGQGYKRSPGTCISHRRCNRTTLLAYAVCLFLFRFLHLSPIPQPSLESPSQDTEPYCPQTSLSSEILLDRRTGATKALGKLPVHLMSTLRCVPNYIIYSDYEEDIQGHDVCGFLNGVNGTLKNTVPEFQLHNYLQAHGRVALSITV